ncbi:MAG TPA: PEP-utilizing enzyme, partial [Gemmatimonadales bacterium]|nr:PEP-utilizing enzyme [Gemmatimonadales bacterium]
MSGSRTPLPIAALKQKLPHTYQELERVARTLERHFRDVQDMEFTVERGVLYMLQTRRGQRSGPAAVRIACDMVDEGLISEEEAVARIPPNDLNQLLHPTIDPQSKLDLLTTGLPASPGAACGTVVFDADRAEKMGRAGQSAILVRRETSPEDFHGMVMAKAILTARGGMTSHAAVVARGMGKPCVAGAQELQVDEKAGRFSINGRSIAEGDWITVDGGSGKVYAGQAALITPEPSGNFLLLMQWADRIRQLRVRVNADTPADAHRGRDFGAEGIGLCRTEHMFFDGERLTAMREMIVAPDKAGRERALAKLLPMQRGDFEAIFRAMEGYPVTIRLLDPPLHEFLPHDERLLAELHHGGRERDHHFGHHPALAGRDRAGSLEDRPHLHGGDLGIDDPQPAAAEPEHRVDLVQSVNDGLQGVHRDAELAGQRLDLGALLGQEFVQRRVQQPDGDRKALHRAEDGLEVRALHRQEVGERALAADGVRGDDHLPHCGEPVTVEEHVLGAAEPDPFGAEVAAAVGVGRRVGVDPHAELADPVGPLH